MNPSDASEPSEATTGSRLRGRAMFALKVVVTVAALSWLLTRAPLAELSASAHRMSALALFVAFVLVAANLTQAAARSRIVLAAYGAPAPPRFGALVRLQWVGLFFNTVIPGNVGGDMLRAHAMRDAFQGGPNAFVVVLLERVFGLAGLLTLSATILAIHPVPGVAGMSKLAALGVVAALLAAMAPLVGRRLGSLVGGRVGELLLRLPAAGRPSMIGLAFLASISTQAMVAVTGLILVRAVSPNAPAAAVLALVPVAQVATYFPATIAGLGVREAAFVVLLSQAGVPKADATVASLAMLGIQLVVALIGGLLHLTTPIAPTDARR